MYRVFSRRWWQDAACTKPATNARKTTIAIVHTEAEARAVCHAHNHDEDGNRIYRPFGSAYEYTAD